MLAVIKTGGKQYLVKPGDIIDIEKITGDEGSEVEFSDVLMVSDGEGGVKVGTPVVESAQVKGTILGEKKEPRLLYSSLNAGKDTGTSRVTDRNIHQLKLTVLIVNRRPSYVNYKKRR